MLREAVQDDLDILWDFLAIASYEPDAAAARADPIVASYLTGWRRPGDFGLIAEQDGAAAGAIWARQFTSADYKFQFGERTPELAIAVHAPARGKGLGETLLRAMIAETATRGLGLCLSVRDTNPARRLYERLGFEAAPGMSATNRTGGQSTGMLLRRSP